MLSGVLVLVCSLAGPGGNLLLNSSFEALSGGNPSDWALFVMPKPGAEGRVDDTVFSDGRRSVVLRNAELYPNEPLNNWSQNIVKDLAGRTLLVGGLIKTEEATAADIWLQCWRKNPWGVLLVSKTSESHPVLGAMDWTPVAMKVEVPEETDFVTVRCVLKGKGAAWFDDVRVIDASAEESLDKQVEALSQELGKKKTEKPSEVHQEKAPEPAPPEKPAPPGPDSLIGGSDQPRPAIADDKAEGSVKELMLREAESLTEAVRTLKETNEALRKELSQVRKELKDVRRDLQDTKGPASAPAPATSAAPQESKPAKRVPPLVPRGYDWEEVPDEG